MSEAGAMPLRHSDPPLAAAVELGAWRDLAASALEPNAYYLPEWVLAANAAPDERAAPRVLFGQGSDGRLTGLLPVQPLWPMLQTPLRLLMSADPFRSLNTPLLHRDYAAQGAAALIAAARASGARALLLRDVAIEGDTARALNRAVAAEGLQPVLLRRWSRASLDARQDAEALLRSGLGPKKLKDYRRLKRRLAEHGPISFTVARSADDIDRAYDVFLALEDSGWKGRRGSSLARQPARAAMLRRAAIALAAQGQCEIVQLTAGGTPVASGIILRHLDRAYFFKLGIAEGFARQSPGALLTIEITRHLCADPVIAMADSTAGPDHPMIGPIWRGRIEIGDVLIPLRAGDPLIGPITIALRTRETLRRTAKRLLRR